MSNETWIAVAPRIVGNQSAGFETVYESDLKEFETRKLAISHGFEVIGCDDFLVASLEKTKLTGLAWMEEPRSDGEELAAIGKQFDIEVAP